MTLRKPDDMSTIRWLTSGLNLKTVVTTIVLLMGAHYALGTRITVVEQHDTALQDKFSAVDKRLDSQLHDIQDVRKTTLLKDTYEADQRRIADELREIQASEGRIETILMENRSR